MPAARAHSAGALGRQRHPQRDGQRRLSARRAATGVLLAAGPAVVFAVAAVVALLTTVGLTASARRAPGYVADEASRGLLRQIGARASARCSRDPGLRLLGRRS